MATASTLTSHAPPLHHFRLTTSNNRSPLRPLSFYVPLCRRAHQTTHRRLRGASLCCDRKTNVDNTIISFCKMGNLKNALHCLLQLDATEQTQLDPAVYSSVLQLCADHNALSEGKRVHNVMASSGLAMDSGVGAKLVFMYVKCGDLEAGRSVLDDVIDCKISPFLWSLLLKEHVKIGDFQDCVFLFEKMRLLGVDVNAYSLSCILKCVAVLGNGRSCQQVHGLVLKSGFGDHVVVVNSLISSYCKHGRLENAIEAFDGMPMRDVVSWNSIINGCVSNGFIDKAVAFLKRMWYSGVGLDLLTLMGVIPACAALGVLAQGKVIHGYAVKCGYKDEVILNNSLIDMYSKSGDFDSAVRIFENMDETSVISWASMITSYARAGKYKEAIGLLERMEVEGVKPDHFVITSALNVCASSGSLDQGKYVHSVITREGFEFNLFVSNALMDMYVKCGSVEDARIVFNGMVEKDIVSWNTMIGGYSKNHLPNEAFGLFQNMQLHVKPNSITMSCILRAVASLLSLERGKQIHGYILRNGFFSDGPTPNALVDMYAKCGAISLARQVFELLTTKDLISWTVMIAGYGLHGDGKEAISLFKQMQLSKVEPNEVSFIAVMYACAHSGLVDEGWRLFNIMRNDYKLEPKLEHYACMVDLLSRAGHLRKAYKFIQSMPMEPDSGVWGALLWGCRIQRNAKLAEEVAEHIFALEPDSTRYYVLLSDIYEEAEKWENVRKIRQGVGRRVLQQPAESSWIELKGKTHIFVAGGNSYPQAKEIETFMETVRIKMENEWAPNSGHGSARNASLAKKNKSLCGHSERRALAFGILNSPGGTPVRVAKNSSTCGDCHETSKFISKMVKRKIILRDCNRFHHFAEGRCSCRA